MKKTAFKDEIRALGAADLRAKALELREEIMKSRFRKKTSATTEQVKHIGQARKKLARVLTALNSVKA